MNIKTTRGGDVMYLYSITNTDDECILTHVDKFTQNEFTKMCDEIPKRIVDWGDNTYTEYYQGEEVKKHLIAKHGFKETAFQAWIFAG